MRWVGTNVDGVTRNRRPIYSLDGSPSHRTNIKGHRHRYNERDEETPPSTRPSVVRRPSCSDSDDRGEIMLRCGISSGSLRSPIWPSISLSALLLRPSFPRRHHHRTRPTPTRPRPPRRHHCTGCFAVVRVCSTVVGLIARRIGNLRRAAL